MGFPRALSKWLVLFVGLTVALPATAKPLTKAEANQVISEGEYLVKTGRRVHHPAGSRAVVSNAKRRKKKPVAYRVATRPTRKKETHRSFAPKKTGKTMAKRSSVSKKVPRTVARKASPAKSTRKTAKKAEKKLAKTKSRASRSIASVPKRGKSKKSETKRSSKHASKRGKNRESKHAKKDSRSSSRRRAAKSPKRRFPVARETPNERDMPFVSIPHRKVSRHDRTIVMDDPAVRSPLPEPRAPSPELKPDATALAAPEGEPAEVGRAKAEMAPPPIVGPAPASVTETPPEVAVAPSMPEISAVPPEAAAAAAARANGREPDAFDLHTGADPLGK